MIGLGTESKIVDLDTAVAQRAVWRKEGLQVVLTNGCFDLLHAGHIRSLEAAAALGDILIVLVNSDTSIKALKGIGRPIIHEPDRLYSLAALACVDLVVAFRGTRCASELRLLAADIYAKDERWKKEQDPDERAALLSTATRMCWLPHTDGISTTDIIRAIRITGRPIPFAAAPKAVGCDPDRDTWGLP